MPQIFEILDQYGKFIKYIFCNINIFHHLNFFIFFLIVFHKYIIKKK